MVTTTDQADARPTGLNTPMPQQISSTDALTAPDDPIVLRLPAQWRLTDDAFFDFFELNDPLSFERTAEGYLVIVPPPSGPSPRIGPRISAQLVEWIDAGGGGVVADSSGGYKLGETPPTGEEQKQPTRIPDVSWIPDELFASLDPDEILDDVPRVCPPFVVEIISARQSVGPQQKKMTEWLSYGVLLGWLLDPKRGKAWIYRAGQTAPEELDRPATLSGERVLEGFNLDCSAVWDLE